MVWCRWTGDHPLHCITLQFFSEQQLVIQVVFNQTNTKILAKICIKHSYIFTKIYSCKEERKPNWLRCALQQDNFENVGVDLPISLVMKLQQWAQQTIKKSYSCNYRLEDFCLSHKSQKTDEYLIVCYRVDNTALSFLLHLQQPIWNINFVSIKRYSLFASIFCHFCYMRQINVQVVEFCLIVQTS